MSTKPRVPETLFEFQSWFATEEACESYLFDWRWPDGFSCPRCGHKSATKLANRRQYQCCGCKYQVSVTAGTAMHKTKLSLRKWFWAMFLVARHKKSISALQLQRDLGIGSYRTAWLLLQKIRHCFSEKAEYPLRGLVEVDETLIGAKGRCKPGKDPGNKAIVVAAVALGERKNRGHRWSDVRARRVADYSGASLSTFVFDNVRPGACILTDGWSGYNAVAKDYRLNRIVSSAMTVAQMRSKNPMPHVHLFFANLKTWLSGRFHGVSQKYLPRYLDEHIYRLNRRHSSSDIFGWVVRRLMNGSPRTLHQVTAEPST